MNLKTFAFVITCLLLKYLSVKASHPQAITRTKHDPALEEDDSARCRLSGICEGSPNQQECIRRSTLSTSEPNSFAQDIIAARRDALLACEFDPADRAEWVKEAAQWTWKGYRDCADGWDELCPLSCKGQHWHNLTLTPVDALDTLLLMGLEDEYNEAVEIIRRNLNYDESEESNMFETTIRILGGLLSAHYLNSSTSTSSSSSVELLDLAADLGSRLFLGFDSPTSVPYSDINLKTGSVARSQPHSSTSEVATLSLEFTLLARLTNESKFETAAMAVHEALTPLVEQHKGLLPQFISPSDASSSGDYIMLGARSDSYYEYLLKQWIMTGRTDELMLKRFIEAMQAVRERLLRRSRGQDTVASGGVDNADKSSNDSETTDNLNQQPQSLDGLLYVAEQQGGSMSPKMDHLVCFLPGVLALGDFYNISTVREDHPNDPSDLEIARELAETCYQMYRRTPTGLAPEIVFFEENNEYPGAHASDIGGGDFMIKQADSHNLLRPETVESLFILWKVTGDPLYRDQAWLIFRAFERWTRVEGIQQCLSVAPEAAVKAASIEAAKVAAREAVKVMAEGGSAEHAAKEGKRKAEALIQSMRLHVEDDAANIAQMAEEVSLTAAVATAEAIASILSNLGIDLADQDVDALLDGGASENKTEEAPGQQNRDRGSRSSCASSSLLGGGYSNLESVTSVPPPRRDKMESFWIAETLKYLYLIFTEPPDRCLHPSCAHQPLAEARLPLTRWVFNTEAHPLPIVGPMNESTVAPVEFDRQRLDPFAADGSVEESISEPLESGQPTTEEIEEEEEEEEDDEAAALLKESLEDLKRMGEEQDRLFDDLLMPSDHDEL